LLGTCPRLSYSAPLALCFDYCAKDPKPALPDTTPRTLPGLGGF
jgi:hypothetical protein